MIISIFFMVTLVSLTYEKKPYLNDEHNSLIKWISDNTKTHDTFFVPSRDNNVKGEFLTFYIRIFANRSIYVDDAFPFDHDFVQEWAKRYNLYINFYDKNKLKTNECINELKNFEYIIFQKKYNDPRIYEHNTQTYAVFNTSNNLKLFCLSR